MKRGATVEGNSAEPADDATVTRLAPAEAAFRQREILYRDVVNALPAAIYTTDAAGRITFFNEAAAQLAGRRPVLGADQWCVTWRLFNPDGSPMPHDQCPMAVALKEGRAVRGVEAIAERPDGGRIWFAPYPTPLRDEDGAIIGAVNMLVDITTRKQVEERQRLLTEEVNHRAKNILAVVYATLQLSRAASVEEFKEVMEGRIRALSHAHNLLAESRWAAADLQKLLGEELKPYLGGEEARAWMSGAPTPLEPATAQCLAMVVHELATNAAKYGALSHAGGRVLIDWRTTQARLILRWSETGGPACRAPRQEGVGARVIRGAISQLGGEIDFDWRRSGLACEIRVPAAALDGATDLHASPLAAATGAG